ncbi:MAG: tetratricopeptide repeat protein [Deltaproteobacteria bacterium]|nr:tetratricopeptide repeat protein [Deltaproteobacteria bacterium]
MEYRIRPRLIYLLILNAVFVIYLQTFSFPFHFDDASGIVDNVSIRALANFRPSWTAGGPLPGQRYVGMLSFALNYRLGGLNVLGYHMVNNAVHFINGILVLHLVLLTLDTPAMERPNQPSSTASQPSSTVSAPELAVRWFMATAASLIFVAHPVQTQAVTYIVQRFTSLATLFYLLSIILYAKARLESQPTGPALGKRTALFYAGSLVSAVLAMKTKEISFTLPFVIALYEFVFFKDGWKKRFLYIFPFLLTLAIIPLSVIGAGVAGERPLANVFNDLARPLYEKAVITRGVYLLTQTRVMVTYVRLLFLPVNQNLDYDYPLYGSFLEPGVFLSFLFLLSIIAAALYLFMRSRKTGNGHGLLISFGIFWFFITLSVESSVIPIKDVIFEHRLYLPGIGAIIAFTSCAFYAFERMKINMAVAATVLIATTVLPLGAAAYMRNRIWRDGLTLWSDVAAKSPAKARGHINLGHYYADAGRLDDAVREMKLAIRLKPSDAAAYYNLGVVYRDKGMVNDAIGEFKEALNMEPSHEKAKKALKSLSAFPGQAEGS